MTKTHPLRREPTCHLTVEQLQLEIQKNALQEKILFLEKTEKRYRDLYEFSPINHFCLDNNKVITQVNLTGAALLGIEKSKLLGKKCLSGFIVPDYRAVFEEHYRRTLSSRAKQHCEVQMMRKDGTIFHAYIESIALSSSQENAEQFLLSITDITERKFLEEQSRQHYLSLQQVANIQSAGVMTSVLAHELSQPFTAIANFMNGCMRRLRMGDYPREKLLAIMEETIQQVERADKILHKIKESVFKSKPQVEKLHLQSLIHTSLAFFNKTLTNTNVTIGVKCDDSSVYVMADALQIELVLINLLHNSIEAMKHMPKTRKKIITVAIKAAIHGSIKVSIIDTGSGFDQNNAHKLFNPHFSTKQGGLGIGLWICRNIVEAHNGQLTADLTHSGGACFVFTLPIIAKDDDQCS